MKRDIEQNIWFKENKLNLVRITDEQFNNLLFDAIIEMLV